MLGVGLGGSFHILSQCQVAHGRVLLFMDRFSKNLLNQEGWLGGAEGKAGKGFCTESIRFFKDMEKTEGAVRGRKVCLTTYPFS